jgi:hypothetical protein
LFIVTFENREIILSFAIKVLLQAHIFAAFSGVLQHVVMVECARQVFLFAHRGGRRRFGRTHPLGASGRKHAPIPLISYDALRRAPCVRRDAWPTRRGAFGRADGSCASRVSASRVSASRASASTLQPCVLQFWP